MNDAEMMHIVVVVLMTFVAGAELTRNGMVMPKVAHQMDKVYSLFTQVRNLLNGTKRRRARQIAEAKSQPPPTWLEMTKHHGHEKILLGLLGQWHRGKDPQTQMRHIPAKVLKWLARWQDDFPHWKTVRDFAKKLRAEDGGECCVCGDTEIVGVPDGDGDYYCRGHIPHE